MCPCERNNPIIARIAARVQTYDRVNGKRRPDHSKRRLNRGLPSDEERPYQTQGIQQKPLPTRKHTMCGVTIDGGMSDKPFV